MTMKHYTLAWIAILAGVTALAPVAVAQEWPQWRGPNRDGAVTSFREPTAWPEGLTEQWKVDVGLGYATPVLVDDRIYMYTRQDEDEVMNALDATSGEVIWRTSYALAKGGPPLEERRSFCGCRLGACVNRLADLIAARIVNGGNGWLRSGCRRSVRHRRG